MPEGVGCDEYLDGVPPVVLPPLELSLAVLTWKIFGPKMKPRIADVITKMIPHQIKYLATSLSLTIINRGTPIINAWRSESIAKKM